MELNNFISSTSVSSVLNRDIKQFGKKFLFDGNDETCWNSDQGEVQHITLMFDKTVLITNVNIQFQGGFSCKEIEIKLFDNTGVETSCLCYPEDVNIMQSFKIDKSPEGSKIKILFKKHTDFFGRIIIYNLQLYGMVS